MEKKAKNGSELLGVSRLITEATLGITDVVERAHQRILLPPFLPSTPIQHLISNITAITYKTLKKSTRFVGENIEKIIELAPQPKVEKRDNKEIIRSALNGVIGDYLEKKDNPLKMEMQFRTRNQETILSKESINKSIKNVNGKILLMIHGSVMNDVQWSRKDHNHGELLAEELNKSLVYIYYNSGKHVSTNGKEFSELLETLVSNWPVPVEEIVFIGYSMGGLLARSVLYYGKLENKKWVKYLKKNIFLGTPHHGSSLERNGNLVDVTLSSIYYTKPFARLGKIRSAGVTDLRYGNLIDEDWKGDDRFERLGDQRKAIPLSKSVKNYSIAASLGTLKDLNSGDGLVSIDSAFGKHDNQTKSLNFEEENTKVVYGVSHLGLLNSLSVYDQLKEWVQD